MNSSDKARRPSDQAPEQRGRTCKDPNPVRSTRTASRCCCGGLAPSEAALESPPWVTEDPVMTGWGVEERSPLLHSLYPQWSGAGAGLSGLRPGIPGAGAGVPVARGGRPMCAFPQHSAQITGWLLRVLLVLGCWAFSPILPA